MNWLDFVQSKSGLLVVGHGTRRGTGVAQLLELKKRMSEMLPLVPIEASFLELAEPTIFEAMKRLKQGGVEYVVIMPILLFEAGHAKSDIPEAVDAAAGQLGMAVLGQTDPLGTHPSALQLSSLRFDSAMKCTNRLGCLRAGGCDRVADCWTQGGVILNAAGNDASHHPPVSAATLTTDIDHRSMLEIGLAMVGRGTSDEAALASMRHFTKLRWERRDLPIAWCNTGFFAGGRPTVDELLDEAANATVDVVVVQPHLLFEGELIDQLRQKVDRLRAATPDKRWLVAMPLGSDTALAGVFLDLAAEKIREIGVTGDP